MAIRPDYQTGTIDLVASSANFTTTGAALQMVAVQPGDAIITPSGHVLIIATITGQNSGTLFLPCPAAAAGTDLPLRIRFQPDGSRYQGAVRNLIDLLSSGNLEAFAALVGADGMVPIFTGPGTMDLADPATFGIQDPNGSLGKLAALTLGNRQILQTDAAGSLKSVGLTPSRFLLTDANGDVSQPESIPFGVNLAGSNGNMDFAQIQQKNSFVMANNSVIWFTRSGLLLVNDISDGSVGLFVLGGNGGGSVTKLSGGFRFDTNLGTAGKVNVFFASNEYNHYEIQNLTGGPVTLRTIFIVTREAV